MEKFRENLNEAVKRLQIADHMTYVTYPLVNERRLLLKIFDEIYKAVINSINTVLNYEYLYKRIVLYQNNGDNLNTFMNKCARWYGLSNQQIKKMKELIELNRRHIQSAMEFVKKDKLVIMNDSLSTQILDIRLIKEYLLLAKEFLMKVNKKVGANF